MNVALLFLACGTADQWTETAVWAPHLARPDQNHDGGLSPDEFARVASAGTTFELADLDHDGVIQPHELRQLVESQSPTSFDGTGVKAPAPPGVPVDSSMNVQQRHVWEVLTALADESRRVNGPAISPADFKAAVASGALESPESRVVLEPIRASFDAQGWSWPLR